MTAAVLRELADGTGLEVVSGYDRVRIQGWGSNSLRVRARRRGEFSPSRLGALLPSAPTAVATTIPAGEATVVSGSISAAVDGDLITFTDPAGRVLLAEQPGHFLWPGARSYLASSGSRARVEQRFAVPAGERIYGLGQHQHGRLDQRGLVIDLLQRNCEVSIPFVVSSNGYGLLWNTPAVGRVELGSSETRWVADSGDEIDYWITAGSPADILSSYADRTGHPPEFPDFASGFWQSKLRYRTQEELLSVAREYHRRELPLSVIVADFFHWTQLGDWRFDPEDWPDPHGMIEELDRLGVRLMVSIWPSLASTTEHHREMADAGLLVANQRGVAVQAPWVEKATPNGGFVSFYDPTNPEARAYVWEQVRDGYYRDGVRLFWLDACEPEIRPDDHVNLLYHAGPGDEVGCRYPLDHARTFFDGLRSEGHDEIISLCRSAWAGSQRYGALVWSGDIPATFAALRAQVPAGLNIALSGIPWWTTDIGGFHGGDGADPEYRELIIRWFQYAVYCPVLRLHGEREPRHVDPTVTGGPNEVWSFGDGVYRILTEQLGVRERLRPYIHELMAQAHRTGMPPMRPLFVDHPDDPGCWQVEDQYQFGPYVLVAPVTVYGSRRREVYLPPGHEWIDTRDRSEHPGGQTIECDAPLDSIPVLLRSDGPRSLLTALGVH